MGGISTSHSASLSNHKTSASKEFDLRNWRGLTDLLRVGRESIPDPRAYAEFRNLVLGYAQRGGDAEIRRNIDTIVATFAKNKVSSETTEKKLEVKPVVSAPTPTPTPTPKPEPVTIVAEHKVVNPEPVRVVELTPVTPPVSASTRPSLGIPTRRMQPRFNNVPTQTFIPKEVSDIVPPPPSQSAMSSNVSVSEVSDRAVLEEENKDEIKSEDALLELKHEAPKTQEEYKARITEIKHLVHEKVGNPVALMGAHNAHGKKYMTALLSALKATSAGSLDEMHEAVESLEHITKALLEDAPLADDMVPPPTRPVVEPVSVPVVEEKVIPVLPQKEVAPEVVIPEEKPIRHFTPQEIVAEDSSQSEREVEDESSTPLPQTVIEQKPKAVPEPIIMKEEGRVPLHKYSVSEMLASKSSHEPAQRVSVEPEAHVDAKRWQTPEVIEEKPYITSVLGEEAHHPRTKHVYKAVSVADPEVIKEVIGIDTQKVTTEQTELYSPKITEALQQLLHEWSIFGGSGLFGIGPGGAEHPLYIRLSLLSMGELLAGRWEKADPKLIKVIKQYVDAWRHEQGIAYTIDETFEHYLRRVVQKILKRQS
jgi:hypothetical protein